MLRTPAHDFAAPVAAVVPPVLPETNSREVVQKDLLKKKVAKEKNRREKIVVGILGEAYPKLLRDGNGREKQAEDFFSGKLSSLAKKMPVLRDREFKSRRQASSSHPYLPENGKTEAL